MPEVCDCCLKEKEDVTTQAVGPGLAFNICGTCAEEMRKPGTSARRWLDQKREERAG